MVDHIRLLIIMEHLQISYHTVRLWHTVLEECKHPTLSENDSSAGSKQSNGPIIETNPSLSFNVQFARANQPTKNRIYLCGQVWSNHKSVSTKYHQNCCFHVFSTVSLLERILSGNPTLAESSTTRKQTIGDGYFSASYIQIHMNECGWVTIMKHQALTSISHHGGPGRLSLVDTHQPPSESMDVWLDIPTL